MLAPQRLITTIGLGLISASLAFAQTPNLVSATDSSNQPSKKKLPFVDLRVVPVGPILLAKFGRSKNPPTKAESATSAEEGNDKDKAIPGGPRGFIVLQADQREMPPRSLYLKQGEKYIVIPCSQNSIGTPLRIFLKSPQLVFYTRKRNDKGNDVFKKYHTHAWQADQKNLLLTITKPLKSRYWDKPQIHAYNLSQPLTQGSSAIVINTSLEKKLGIIANGKSLSLRPHSKKTLAATTGVTQLKLGLITGSKKLHAPQRLTLPNRASQPMLILSYSCSKMESFRGIKIIRSRLIPDQFRKASSMSPRKSR